jgi:tetratricopeptide (TPR) repeat protein
VIAGEHDEGRRLAEAAFATATELGLDELRAHALTTIGMAKNDVDLGSGVADMERALEIALAADAPVASAIVNNLAVYSIFAGDFRRTDELYAEATRLGERYGHASSVRFVRGNRIWLDFMLGRWDRALESADTFIAECEAGSPHTLEYMAREVRSALWLARGDQDAALRDQLQSFEHAQTRHEPFHRLGSLAITAALYAELGQVEEAHALAVQVPPIIREVGLHGALTRLGPFADELGIGDELRDAVTAGAGPRFPFWRSVIEQVLAGELVSAADLMASAGNPMSEANLRRHAGMRMLHTGEAAAAEVELVRALAFYRSVDASAYIAQIESALAGAQSESA